jgi:RimJ/RimL family protein N-acetyltransferase
MTMIDLQPTHLEDQWIKLVPLGPDDLERLYAVASDPLIWEQHPSRDRYQRDVFQKFFDDGIASGGAFLILEVATGDVMGSSRYYDLDCERRTVAIGYTFLARKYWGGHYNKSLKSLMLDHAFEFADTVIFHIGSENVRSQKATVKIGALLSPELSAVEPRENTLVFVLTRENRKI